MDYLEEAVNEVIKEEDNNVGGPFGAVIVKDNKIIGRGCNRVLKDNDPTAHAEIVAIRNACQKLHNHDLKGCVIYSTSEPCPMCLSAIIWSNIKVIYYGTDREDVKDVGFRDDYIYNYLKKPDNSLKMKQIDNKECDDLLKNYNKTIY